MFLARGNHIRLPNFVSYCSFLPFYLSKICLNCTKNKSSPILDEEGHLIILRGQISENGHCIEIYHIISHFMRNLRLFLYKMNLYFIYSLVSS